jgi:hypothetical protein
MSNRELIFAAVCSILSIYFFCVALWPVFPPSDITEDGKYLFLILSMFFLLAPFAKKIEVFQVLTFESQIKEIKEKVETANAEIKHLQSIQATLTNSLSSVNTNTNNVYVDLYNESRDAAFSSIGPLAIPKNTIPPAFANTSYDDEFPPVEGLEMRTGRPLDELILLRTDLEKSLRLAMGKKLDIYGSNSDAKYLTSRKLFEMVLEKYPSAAKLGPSFDFFLNTANAATHGQNIPINIVRDALVIGTALLKQIDKLRSRP